jgi:hypothetical protein
MSPSQLNSEENLTFVEAVLALLGAFLVKRRHGKLFGVLVTLTSASMVTFFGND